MTERKTASQPPHSGNLGMWFALAALAPLPGAAWAAVPAVSADVTPTKTRPVIYQIRHATWTEIKLVFDLTPCATPLQDAEISLSEDAYGRGALCNGQPKEFSNFSIKVNGEWYGGDRAEFVRSALMNGHSRFLPVHYGEQNNPNRYYSPEGYTNIRVTAASVTPLQTESQWASFVARNSKAPIHTAAAPSSIGTLEEDLARSLAQSFARAPRIQIGMGMGMASLGADSVHVNVAGVQTQDYQFLVKPGARCVASGAKQRCTYAFMLKAAGSFAGISIPPQNSGWLTRTDVFDKSGQTYRSAAVDQLMLKAATPEQTVGRGSPDNFGSSKPDGGIPDLYGTMCDLGSKSWC